MRTALDIVNEMLAATGTAPLTSNDTAHPSYVKAYNKLITVSTRVQGSGWWFNKGVRTLNPDVYGNIILPAGTVHCDPTDRYKNYVMRGTKLFDVKNNTFNIGSPVEVRIVVDVDVEDLPPQAQDYIAARAVFEYYRDEGGVNPKLGSYQNDRDTAWTAMRVEDLRNRDLNWFDSAAYNAVQRPSFHPRLPTTGK